MIMKRVKRVSRLTVELQTNSYEVSYFRTDKFPHTFQQWQGIPSSKLLIENSDLGLLSFLLNIQNKLMIVRDLEINLIDRLICREI